jgi:hypothetical protein
MKAAPISFERFEYKYWLTDAQVQAMRTLTAPYLRCDDFALGGQRNTSLYLDSDDLDFLDLHVQKTPDRPKLRIRAYGNPPSGNAYFEVKRKIKRVTFKDRAVVPMDAVPALLRGEIPKGLKLKNPAEMKTLEHFLYLMIVFKASPKVLITCSREAFTSIDSMEGVRLTFDRDICYQPARGPTLQGDPKAWVHLCGQMNYQPEAPTLAELKFKNIAPRWVSDMVQRLQLQLSACSKYVMAMSLEALGGDGLVGQDLAQAAPPPQGERV